MVAIPHSRPAIRIEAETHVDFDDVGLLLQAQVARHFAEELAKLGARTLAPCTFAGDRKLWHQPRRASSPASNSMCPDEGLTLTGRTCKRSEKLRPYLLQSSEMMSCLSVSFLLGAIPSVVSTLFKVGSALVLRVGCERSATPSDHVCPQSPGCRRKTSSTEGRARHWDRLVLSKNGTHTVATKGEARSKSTAENHTGSKGFSFSGHAHASKHIAQSQSRKTPQNPAHRAAQAAIFCGDRRLRHPLGGASNPKKVAAKDPIPQSTDGDSDRYRAGIARGDHAFCARGAPPNCSARPQSCLDCRTARLACHHPFPNQVERVARLSQSPVAQPPPVKQRAVYTLRRRCDTPRQTVRRCLGHLSRLQGIRVEVMEPQRQEQPRPQGRSSTLLERLAKPALTPGHACPQGSASLESAATMDATYATSSVSPLRTARPAPRHVG